MIEPVEPFGISEILFDGISDMKIVEGVARMVLYAKRNNEHEVVARLAIPISELPEVIQALVIGLTTAAKTIIKPMLSS